MKERLNASLLYQHEIHIFCSFRLLVKEILIAIPNTF